MKRIIEEVDIAVPSDPPSALGERPAIPLAYETCADLIVSTISGQDSSQRACGSPPPSSPRSKTIGKPNAPT
jgi:hypothetical protein